ncbi:MAG: hypothetical protein J3R72DRAFT_461454 [Linnemannia gamsii]|nr:MAG: hypothetical protein J3R72DRAFT_461454 [Linnemannia gamsii]
MERQRKRTTDNSTKKKRAGQSFNQSSNAVPCTVLYTTCFTLHARGLLGFCEEKWCAFESLFYFRDRGTNISPRPHPQCHLTFAHRPYDSIGYFMRFFAMLAAQYLLVDIMERKTR